MSQYISLNEFLQKYANSPVEFKMYIGNKIQTDPEFGLSEVGGETKEKVAKSRFDSYAHNVLNRVEQGDREINILRDGINQVLIYQIKINKTVDAEHHILDRLQTVRDYFKEDAKNILLIDVWQMYDINDDFCIIVKK